MRSPGGTAAPVGRRLSVWVFAATPSLATLIQLLVGVVGRVPPAGALVCEPGVEPRRHQAVGAILTLPGAGREGVGVFILRGSRGALDPAPLHLRRPRGLDQVLPQGPILGHPAPALPDTAF